MGEDQIVDKDEKEEENEPEEPTVRERAEEVSERWDQALEDFQLPCPVDDGRMKAQGVAYSRLYTFAAGEPGVVKPVDTFMVSFVCNECGYTATFDAKEFNPAYLAHLEGEQPQETARLTRAGYRILVPLRELGAMETLLDLATAIASSRGGDVLVFSLAPSEADQSSLEERVRDYEPVIGDRVPYLARKGRWQNPRGGLDEALSEFDFDLLLVPASDVSSDEQEGVLDRLHGALLSPTRDTAIVHDRGLESVNRVLLATAGGSNARAAAPLVLNVVSAFQAELRILYVVGPGQEEGKQAGLSRISDTLESVNVADIDVEKKVIVSDDPMQAIVDQAKDCDLLMLGGSPLGRRGEFDRDSFAIQVALKAGITTVIVYARRREQESWIKRFLLGT